MKNIVTVLMILLFMSKPVLSDTFDDIKGDMLSSEVKLLDAPETANWPKKGTISMGAVPRGDNTPIWWQPDNLAYKTSDYWNAINSWFVIYPGEGHTATNTRVMISNITLYILEKSTNSWRKINTETTPVWHQHMGYISPSTAYYPVDARGEKAGAVSYMLNSGINPIHGGIPRYTIDGSDVKAVYATMETKLILHNPKGVDDRAHAQLAASIGVDYYPDMDTEISDFEPMKYVPAAGSSRYGLIKTSARTHYFATINPPGPLNIGAEYTDRDQNVVSSIEDFLSNPPPGVR